MTIYVQSELKKVGGKNLNVMIRNGTDAGIANTAQDVLQASRAYLRRANAAIYAGTLSAPTLKLANRYFLTPLYGITPADLAIIRTVITKTRTGLDGDVTLKTGSLLKGDEAGTLGSVAFKDKDDFSAADFTNQVKSKSYQTWVPTMNPNVAPGDRQRRRGAIHVKAGTLQDKKMGPVTFIHEATHKFAGTWDYCYFEDDGVTPEDVFDDKASALGNADSYAWFIYSIGNWS
ncbi:hypothetical protein [Falsiroseomonas oryziterrae]|uniref:hypothetical protein n=1 Tax=Falsiroseomonas oryziterrae TaxID=2911368 RepID=UPI001F47F220|nr:hypothetical protein [Roseomonas sp. NPKOSM-4]